MSETRALSAALSGPTFEGAASRSALHASERHVDRWAPEGPAATHSRGLRSLAFADRVASPWLSASSGMNTRSAGMFSGTPSERSAPGVSWVFPRPWFQDELDWMAAARQSAEATPQFLTTRGTYATTRASAADVAMPVVAPELVVPSMMAGAMTAAAERRSSSAGFDAGMVAGLSPAAAPMQHGLRSWSPSIPFAAAAAAEVMAGTVSAAATSGLSSVAERSPLLAGLAMVSPASMSGFAGPRTGQAAAVDASNSTIARIEQGRRPEPIAPALMATVSAASSLVAASARNDASVASGTESTTDARDARLSPSSEAGSGVAAPALSAADLAMSAAIGASPAMSGALRAIELLIHSASPSSVAPSASAAGPRPSSSADTTAPISTAAPIATPTWSTLSPVVGPRVAMPAGLGGLAAALDTAHTISQPLARSSHAIQAPAPFARAAAAGMSMAASSAAMTAASSPSLGSAPIGSAGAAGATGPESFAPGFRGFSPVWAQPMSALASVAGERARGVDHLAWSDRWLARFAGASPVAMTALDVAGGNAATTPRLLNPSAPEVVYLHPELGPARMRAAVDANRQIQPISDRAPTPTPRPTGVLRIDDGESVPDSVFAALFAAPATSAPSRSTRPSGATATVAAKAAVDRPSSSMVDTVRGGARPTAADLVAISAPAAPDAGLSPGLASSPMAAAMASVLPLPQAPVFDPRALYAGGMATAYMGGLTARAAAPIGVLASAPTAGALASVARFGDVASAGGAMGGWALRDLPLSPLSLRLAEAAPERTMLATGGDFDIVVRGGGALARGREPAATQAATPSWTSPAAPFRGPTFTAGADLEQVLLTPAARSAATASSRPSSSSSTAAELPATSGAAPTAADTTTPSSPSTVSSAVTSPLPAMALPAIEPELLALRSALLASPTSWSAPLAHSSAPLLLSSAMSVPSTGLTFDPSAMAPSAALESPIVAAGEGGSLPSSRSTSAIAAAAAALARAPLEATSPPPVAPAGARAAAIASPPAMPLLTLPSVGGAAPSSLSIAMAGHAASGTFAPPAHAAGGAASELQAAPALAAGGRPGAFAEHALRWSVAEERSAAGLSFDFVSPEMVLAAKVYGLSPAAAVEASRLAVAGPSALASLATSLDLTFLRSFQQASAAPTGATALAAGGRAATASSSSSLSGASPSLSSSSLSGASPSPVATAGDAPAGVVARAATPAASLSPAGTGLASTSAAAAPGAVAAASSSAMSGWDVSGPGAARGGEVPTWGAAAPGAPARMPRGAFLWPPGAVSALGLRAQSVDGVAGLPVVALELLAAQAVADLGTWVTAFPGADQAALASALRSAGVPLNAMGAMAGLAGAGPIGQAAAAGVAGSAGVAGPAGFSAGAAPELSFVAGAGPMAARADSGAREGASSPAGFVGTEAGSVEAITAAATAEAAAATAPIDDAAWSTVSPTMTPATLRARFEAVYIALARSPEGLSLSPSARAARAMAVVAGSDAGGLSPRARAAAVWSVMPQVFQGDLHMVAPSARGDAESPASAAPWIRPGQAGLAGLASRAGEALGSFVAPASAELATAGGRSQAPSLAERVDAPVYVDTARPEAGSSGASASGGSAASATARPGRTFSQFGGGEPEIPAWFEGAARKLLEDKSGAGGMTLAELVLVTAMPEKQIAASPKGAASHGGGHGASKAHGKHEDKTPDVAKLAAEVYAEVLKLIETARERSGDPYQ